MLNLTATRARLAISVALLAGTAVTAVGADMTEQARFQRCNNNRERIAQLETQMRTNREFMSDEEIARARAMEVVAQRWEDEFVHLQIACVTNNNCQEHLNPRQAELYAPIKVLLHTYSVQCDVPKVGNSPGELTNKWREIGTCMRILRGTMVGKIAKAVTSIPERDRINAELARYRTNLSALRCGESPSKATTPSPPATGTVYDLVATTPDEKWGSGWTVNAGDIEETGADYKASFTWSAPPQRIGANGFSLSLNVAAEAGVTARIDAGIGASGGGFTTEPTDAKVEVLAEARQNRNGSISVRFFPAQGSAPGTKIDLKVGAFYGPGVTYTYQAR